MTKFTGRSGRGGRRRAAIAVLSAVAVLGGIGVSAIPSGATHGPGGTAGSLSLTGSNFEIDTDANLTRDHDSPSIDWASVTQLGGPDSPSGTGDESFGQGTKEDTAVPTVVSGSIPPNKSDLKDFGLHIEGGKYLHLYWTRVQDPSGTTNMDFEFNQGTALSTNGVTPVRTAGDFLITYDLSKGGTVPTISIRKWLASGKWDAAVEITAQNVALASINSTGILAADADGLGDLDPRTFGEASIDLTAVFGTSCGRIGAAYLKSRSSDSFTSALKDFVPPINVNFNNCPPAAPTTTHRVFLSDAGTIGTLGVPGTLTFELYFKPETDTSATSPCDAAYKVTTPTSYAGIAVDATGSAATPSTIEATGDGTYNWIAIYAPGAGSQLLAGSSACGVEDTKVDRNP